ncbi:MAG: GAF domain-containing protein, partial [Anaerolineales bacterium]|nr:GAF domain-containing protein [Anaerolineales bacterium]
MSLHRTATLTAHDRLSALYEVSRVLNSSLELEEALVIVIDAAIRLSGAERGFLMLLEESSGEFHFRVARNANRETLTEDAFEISRSVVQEVIQTGQAVVTLDAQKDPRFLSKASVVNFLLRSIIAIPLRYQGRPMGVLYVDTKTRHARFRQGDLDLLITFADQAAIALVNAQLFEAQKRDAEVRRILLEIAQLAQSATSPPEFLARLAEHLPRWLRCDRCAFFLREPESNEFTLVAATPAADQKLAWANSLSWPGTLLEQRLSQSRSPLRLTAAEVYAGVPTDRPLSQNKADVLVVPVFIAETLTAIMIWDNGWSDRPFTPVVLALAEALGAQLASALHRLQLFETAQRQLAELTALNVVAVAATESVSLADLCEKVRIALKPLLRADDLVVLLVDEDAGIFRPASKPDAPFGHDFTIPLSVGIVGRVAATGRPMRVADVSTVPDYLQLLPTTRSECCVPIKVGTRVIGVINAESSAVNAFSASDERLLVTVAGQLATAIEKQHLLETERQQRELAEALRDVGLALAVDADIEIVLDRLLDYVARVVPYRAACALLVENGVAHTAGLRGYEQLGPGVADQVRALLFDVARTPNLRRMAETGQPLIVGDVLADPDWQPTASSKYLRAWAGAPVMLQDRCVAFLSVEHETPNFYRPCHARRLAAFAGHAALALRNVGLFQSAERRAAELEAVRAASLSLTSSLDLPAVLNAVLEGTLSLLPDLQSTGIYLYDQEHLEFGAALNNAGRPIALPPPRPEGLTYTVARSGEVLIVADTRSHPLFANAPNLWSRAVMGLPLKYGRRVVGVMVISYAEPHQPSEAELRILSLLGEQAAAAIENARLFNAVRSQVEELTFLHSIAVAAAESRTSDELIARATQLIGQTIPARFCGVMLLDEAGANLIPHPSFLGLTPDLNYSVPLGKGITGRVAVTGVPARVGDVSHDPDYLPWHPSIRSELCVPLKSGDHLIGVIDAESERLNAFSERDERLLTTVAGQLALAFEKVRLLEAERAARRQAETLREVANLANIALERSALLERLLELLNQLVPFASASVMLLEGGKLKMVAHHGFRTSAQIFQPLLPEDWPTLSTVLRERRPLLIDRTGEHSFWRQVAGAEYIRCWLGVPLLVHDRVLGVLNVDGEQPGQFSAADVDSVMAFANQAAAALERLNLLEETRRRERELTILLNVARIVSSSLELKSVLDEVARAVAQTFAVEACSISIYDPVARTLTTLGIYAAANPSPLKQVGTTFALADYPLTAHVMENDEVVQVNVADVGSDPAEIALLHSLGRRNLLMLAARAGGRSVGLLELYSSAPERAYSAGELRLLRAIADQVAVAIENGRLFQAEREQRRLAEALHRIAIGLSVSLELGSVLDRLLEQIEQVVPYDMANVMLLDAATGQARVVRHRGYEKFDEQVAQRFATSAFDVATIPNLRRMAESGQPHVIPDVQGSAEWQAVFPSLPICSWAGAPVVLQGRTLAFFNLEKIEPGFYRQAHVERLAAFAGQAALALQNAQLYEAERRRVTALTTLHALSLELSAQLEPSELWPRLLSSAIRLLAVQAGTLYTYSAGTSHLTLRAIHGLPLLEPGQTIGLGQGLAGAVAASHQTLVWHDDARLRDGPEGALTPLPRSALGLPIKLHAQLLGVLVLLDEQPQRFSEADVDILNLFADRAAIAIENVRLLAAVGMEKSRLELLFNLSQSLASTLNPEEVAYRAMDLICATTGAIKAIIFIHDLESGELQPVRLYGYGDVPKEKLAQVRLQRGQGLSGYAAQIRQPVLASDVTQDPHWLHIPFLDDGIRATLALPLLAGDELVGVLSLMSDRPNFLPEEQIPLLRAASVPVALALQNARLFETEARQVYHLTLLNEITQAAVTIESLSELVQVLAERLGELAGAVSCYLDLWDEERQQPVSAAIYGAERATYAAGFASLSQAVLRTAYTLIVEDTYTSPYFKSSREHGLPRSSVMALPLLAGDQKLGAALIVYPYPHHFQLRERQHNEQAARQVALAIARTRLFHETRRNATELEVASTLLHRLSTAPRVLQEFPAIIAGLKQLTQCARVSMFLLSADRRHLELVAKDRALPSPENRLRVPINANTVPDSLLAGQPWFVSELSTSPRLLDGVLGSTGCASGLLWPLRDSQQVSGLLCLLWAEPNGYARLNTHLLGQIADALALAVQKERLLDETLRRTAELEALTDVSAALRSVDTTSDVLRVLLERSRRIIGAETVRVWMPAGEAGRLVVVSQIGSVAEPQPDHRSSEALLVEQVATSGKPRLAEIARLELTDWPWPDRRLRRAMYAPLRLGDSPNGVLAIYAPAPRTFTDAELRLLSAIAEVGGNALQRARVL